MTTDYPGTIPGPWDRTNQAGHFQRVTKGGYELLSDRLGIRLTRPELERFDICDPIPPGAGAPFASGWLRVITCQANPNAGGETTTPRFWFLLVTVIEGDQAIVANAKRRSSSPTKFPVVAQVDERGWFAVEVVDGSSPYAKTGGTPDVLRDDTALALARMQALRKSRELGTVNGSAVVRRFTLAYRVGDRLTDIAGRNCTLRQNAGQAGGEGPTYPGVVAVRWDFDGKQETVLSWSDRRADPPPERRR